MKRPTWTTIPGVLFLTAACNSTTTQADGPTTYGDETNEVFLEGAAAVLNLQAGEQPLEFVDSKGNRWIRQRVLTEFAPEPEHGAEDVSVVEQDRRGWTDEQLAEYFRPLLITNGAQYILDAPPVDIIRRIHQGEFYGGRDPLEPSAGAGGLSPQNVIGTDDRSSVLGTPPGGLSSRQMYMSGSSINANNNTSHCSGSLIGPNTAISSAHCFFNHSAFPKDFYPTRHWAFGIATRNNGGGNQQWSAFGNYVGCYSMWVPSGFVTANTINDDFAVIEFGCSLNPGVAVGAHGSWTASDTQIYNATSLQISGYPDVLGGSGVAANVRVPSLLTHSTGQYWAYVDSGNSTRIVHSVDTTGGQSGAPLLQNIFGGSGMYVTGVHKGLYTLYPPLNHARRFDSTVYAFLKSFTSY